MKTIAISIDEATLERAVRHVRRAREGAGARRGARAHSLSRFVRAVLAEALDRAEREQRETRDRDAFRRHRARLERQARALVAEQAEP